MPTSSVQDGVLVGRNWHSGCIQQCGGETHFNSMGTDFSSKRFSSKGLDKKGKVTYHEMQLQGSPHDSRMSTTKTGEFYLHCPIDVDVVNSDHLNDSDSVFIDPGIRGFLNWFMGNGTGGVIGEGDSTKLRLLQFAASRLQSTIYRSAYNTEKATKKQTSKPLPTATKKKSSQPYPKKDLAKSLVEWEKDHELWQQQKNIRKMRRKASKRRKEAETASTSNSSSTTQEATNQSFIEDEGRKKERERKGTSQKGTNQREEKKREKSQKDIQEREEKRR